MIGKFSSFTFSVYCLFSFKLSNEIEPEHVSPQVSPYRLSAQPCGVHLLRQSLQ